MGKVTVLKAGETRSVNGRIVKGPAGIVDNFLWRETSITGLGANESGPQISISASDSFEKETDMKFDAFVKACGLEASALDDGQRNLLMAAYNAKFPDGEKTTDVKASAGTGGDGNAELLAALGTNVDGVLAPILARIETKARESAAQLEASAKAYEDRVAAARASELKAAQQKVAIAKVFGTGYQDLQAQAMEKGWDEERMMTEKKLRDFETAPPKVDIFAHSGMNAEGAPETPQVLSASLAISGGVTPAQLEASGMDQNVINAAESSQWRGLGYHALVRMAMAASGIPIPHHITPTEYGRLAGEIQARYEFAKASGQLAASTGYTVMNLASITDDAINRSVHARYNVFQSVIPRVASQVSARDFRPLNHYRLMGGGFLKKLADSGELEHLTISDAKFSMEVESQGAMLAVGRKYIVNDDLGIIRQFGEILGFKGAQTLERDFHLMLLNTSFWRTVAGSNGEPINYITGAASAFSYSALQTSYNLWANMQDREGNPLNVGPVVLLVQSGSMALTAKDINKSEKVMTRADNETTDRTNANVFQGMLNNVVETQWLNHSSMGALKTATGWFQFSDPNVQPMFAVGYLDNQRVPKVETAPGSFNTMGQQMRVIFDYGMGQVDDIGCVYNKGAN